MKDKPKSTVEYVDFKSLSEEKKKATFDSLNHTNPLAGKLFKFMHARLTDKSRPEDLI